MKGTELHQLVRSLDKAERDRVLQNARRADKDGEQFYVALYRDLLNTNTYHSDAAFLSTHPKAPYAKSFGKMRDYLEDAILDALRSHRRRGGGEKAPESRIRELIEESQILRSKQLYEGSYERLTEAKQLATNHQYQELLLEILKLERTYLSELGEQRVLEQLMSVVEEIRTLGQHIHAACTTMAVRERLFHGIRFQSMDDENAKVFLAQMESELDAVKEAITGSMEAQTNYHLARSLISLQREQYLDAWEHQHAAFLLWKSHPEFASVRRTQHLKLLSNFLTLSIRVGQVEDFIDAIETLERYPGNTPDEQAESKQNSTYIRLQYFLSRAEWEDALEIERAFNRKPNWATIKSRKPRLVAFHICFARLHFVLGKMQLAESALKRFDSERNGKGHEELLVEAEVMRLLMALDGYRGGPKRNVAEDHDTRNRVRSIKRILQKLKRPPSYLAPMLNGILRIDRLPLAQQATGWPKLWTQVSKTVQNLEFDNAGQMFLAWLQARAEEQAVNDILERNFPRFSAQLPEG
ncbi:MAG: hypothetical protein U0176_05125 [Bacteroidia bacterium]